jgi:hypothetical protein
MHMHRPLLLPFIVIAAVVIGGLLYLYGGAAFHPHDQPAPMPILGSISNAGTVIAQGQYAQGFNERVNYHITSEEQWVQLWDMVYGANGPSLRPVDFSQSEVLAIFDGSHSTGGYRIHAGELVETESMRSIAITHVEPGLGCSAIAGETSPFILVEIPRSALPLTHTDEMREESC